MYVWFGGGEQGNSQLLDDVLNHINTNWADHNECWADIRLAHDKWWLKVGLLTLIVGLSMAEICSAYPTSGGLHFWSAKKCGTQ